MSTSPTPPTPSTHIYLSTRLSKLWKQSSHWCTKRSRKSQKWWNTSKLKLLLRWFNRHQSLQHTNLSSPPFTKWDGTPPTTPSSSQKLQHTNQKHFTQACTTRQKKAYKHLSVAIYANMLASLPQSVSSMLLNDLRFTSNRITIIWHSITHLNPSSSENILLDI